MLKVWKIFKNETNRSFFNYGVTSLSRLISSTFYLSKLTIGYRSESITSKVNLLKETTPCGVCKPKFTNLHLKLKKLLHIKYSHDGGVYALKHISGIITPVLIYLFNKSLIYTLPNNSAHLPMLLE